jgi:hypothetical protein
MRQFRFVFTVECSSDGVADEQKVESMIDLAMQDLVYDDTFVAALGENQAVTIQVSRLDK